MFVAQAPVGVFQTPALDVLELFDAATRAALHYADVITTGDVDDACFGEVAAVFNDDQIVELTATIAWENSSARFNRALRVDSQNLWRPE